MLWLIAALIAYLVLAAVALADKFFVAGPIGSARLYAFYIGILQWLVFLLIPFVDFSIPEFNQIILALFAGICFMLGLFWFFRGLQDFEASRVVPAIGALLPVMIFVIFFIFSGDRVLPRPAELLAFLLLILGGVLVTYQKILPFKGFKFPLLAASFFAVYFVAAKYVFMEQSFWSGFIWMRAGSFLVGLSFLPFVYREIIRDILKREKSFSPKMTLIFFFNQLMGSLGNILQAWSVALAPLVYVAMVTALQGVQYAFLFIFTILLSLKFPKILKEELSGRVIFQKVFAIFLIGAGLAILAVK